MMSENDELKLGQCEVCQQSTERRCSGCKLVFYCNAEHQQANWKEHKNTCKSFEISSNPQLGRYLKATRDLQRGDFIFSETPLVFGPKPHHFEEGPFPCVGCCRLIYDHQKYDRCSGCSWPVCSQECDGLKITTLHGFECNVLKLRLPNEKESFYDYYRFDILIILRALHLQRGNNGRWKKMLQLNDHIDMRGPDSEIFKIIDEKARFLEENYLIPLKLYELQTGAVILQDTSVDIIHKIYGILDVNATELTEDIDAMVLYHTGSLLEHNCTPNTMQNIDEKNKFKITFRTASPIKKGEHITSIYTHILWGTSARRAHLKKTKYFDCNCARCQDPTEFGTYLSALRCIGGEKNPCGGMQLPVKPCEKNCTWVCDKCEIMLPDEDVMKFVDHLNEQVDKVLAEKTTMNNLEDTLTKLLNFLHPNHYLIYSIKHSLLQLYGNEGNIESSNTILQEKLKMCEHLTNLTKTIDPGNARLSLYLGVILHENVTCRLKLLQRMFDEANQQTLTDEIMNISDLMKENKEVLRFVTDTSAGAKLFFEVEKNELKLKNWIKENDIHL